MGAGGDGDYKMSRVFDLALLATADIKYCFAVPNGHRVRNVTQKVVEATGETCVDEVGIYSDLVGSAVDADGFEGSADLNAAVGTRYTGIGGTDALVTAGGWLNTTGAVAYIAIVPTVGASPLGALGKVQVVALMTDET
jgi:hypothetical protein